MNRPKLWRVRVETEVVVVADASHTAQQTAERALRYGEVDDFESYATEVSDVRHLQKPWPWSLPWVDMDFDHVDEMTCAEWLEYIDSIPPSERELEDAGQLNALEAME